ncbi:hypothetical protein HKX48_000399 [Thoreauomyces humboldtii]|nr:hypothetical protein HKX48_000399 [Thoreauomyces humboldtii]
MPSLISTAPATKPSGVKGIFALFRSNKTAADTPSAEESVDFLRKNSASTLVNEEVSTTDSVPPPTKAVDPCTAFVQTVESDIVSMQRAKSLRTYRWKVPASVDARKAHKACKRIGAPGTTFDVETVGTLQYITARWA